MDKKKQMKFNINNFLLATTKILDVRDIEMNNVSVNHSLRVAFIALKIGEKLNLEPKKMFDLCAYSLFHNYINNQNIKLLKIENNSNILSIIVAFVHSIDEKYDFSDLNIENRILIQKHLSTLAFDNEIKGHLLKISSRVDFWLDCQSSEMMLQYIYSSLYDFTEILEFSEVLDITIMFGSLENDIESLLKLSKKMINFYNFEEKDKWTFLIATSMANFGKLSIPKKILEKTGTLSFSEYEIIKSNLYHNKNALRSIYGFDDISKWASRHKEQLDSNGYPFSLSGSDLSLKDRLMSIINIYNSLVKDTTFRSGYTHEKAIEILHAMDKNYQLDASLVLDLEKILS